jgi:KipI family sensor histidine kinase inhibitor
MIAEKPIARILPVGEAAISVEFGSRIAPEINAMVYALEGAIADLHMDGVGETIPSYRSLLVHFDPFLCDPHCLTGQVESMLARLEVLPASPGRLVEIPTVYGGSAGPDLAFVARHNHLSEEDVIAIHSQPEYPVYMMGFTPGFPYLGGMDPRIAAPRLPNPREQVTAGSVGIAGSQTGIYSLNSPGGWRLIGKTGVQLFDPTREVPFLLSPGDRVRFVPIPAEAA